MTPTAGDAFEIAMLCRRLRLFPLLLILVLSSCDDTGGQSAIEESDAQRVDGTSPDGVATTDATNAADVTISDATADSTNPDAPGADADTTDPCADPCDVAGDVVCDGLSTRTCTMMASGCLALSPPSPCDDGNTCTSESCTDGIGCASVNNDNICDDGSLETSNDSCIDGMCNGIPISCVVTQCLASSTPNGTDCDIVFTSSNEPCDDGDVNTENDVCDGQGLCQGTPLACVPTQCDESATLVAGVCERTPKMAGAPCDDGDNATHTDVCDGSALCAGTPIVCTPGNCQVATPNGVDCDSAPAPAGTVCDDGQLTTHTDLCDAMGGCSGTTFSCTPGLCESSSTANGTDCTVVFDGAGTPCDDMSNATGGDVCNGSGGCAGTTIVCPSGICIVSSTPNGVNCDTVVEPPGTPCNDNDLTTAADVCNNGVCDGTPIVCPSGDCVVSSTANGTGCVTVYEMVNTPCNDGQLNTRNDVCNGTGTCAGETYSCPPPTTCQDANNPNGVDCTITFAQPGSSCSDGNVCTGSDTCDGAGGCAGQDRCGDNICEGGCETAATCPADCLVTGGDCDSAAGENACNDWDDCHSSTTGNGLCANIGCGMGQVGNCFCDPTCVNFGDCCQDMQAVCGCP